MTDVLSTSLVAIVKEPGVIDLQPMLLRATFAKALQAERNGDDKLAEELLDKAIEVETLERAKSSH